MIVLTNIILYKSVEKGKYMVHVELRTDIDNLSGIGYFRPQQYT